MKKEAMLALAVLVLCEGVCYPWTAPAMVNPSGYSGPACARNVTPTSEAVQQAGTSKVRILHNWGVPALGAPYYMNEALSTDGGTHWTSWNTVYYDPNLSQYSPSLVRVGNVLHATWYQINTSYRADIFYVRSTDFGATWTNLHQWSSQFNVTSPRDEFPHLAVSSNGQQVVIVWRQSASYPDRGPLVNVWSLDGGLNWNVGGPTQIQGQVAYLANVAYTSYSGGRFIVVYSNANTSPIQINSTYSANGGASWTAPIIVNNYYKAFPRYVPTVATNNSADVMCVWQYAPGQTSNWFGSNRSLDGADSWPDSSEQDFGFTGPPYDLVVSPWQSLTYDASSISYLCAWTAKPGSAYDIYENEYPLLTNPAWGSDVQITNNLNRMGSHGPRISRYPGSGQSNRYITFANGNTASNLTIWETSSSFIPFGGGGQSNGVVSRGEERVPMVRVMPNPAKGFVTIRYSLGGTNAKGVLNVYLITGQLVKTVSLEGGSTRELTWNLKDEEGKPVANGVYLLRLDGSDVHLSERMVVLR